MPDSIVRWLENQHAPLPYLDLRFGQVSALVCEGKQQQTCPVQRPCRHLILQ